MEHATAQAFADSRLLQSVAGQLCRAPVATAAAPLADTFLVTALFAALARKRFLQGVVRTLGTRVSRSRDLPSPLLLTVFLTIPKPFLFPGVRCLGAGGGGPPQCRNGIRCAPA